MAWRRLSPSSNRKHKGEIHFLLNAERNKEMLAILVALNLVILYCLYRMAKFAKSK